MAHRASRSRKKSTRQACLPLMRRLWLSALLAGCASGDVRGPDDDAANVGSTIAAITVPATWRGDSSGCLAAKADKVVQTVGGDIGGINQEFRTIAPMDPGTGHPNCDGAYIVDFIMPTEGNVNPGWHAAYLNGALNPPADGEPDPSCTELWQNAKIYAYWTYNGEPKSTVVGETSKVGDENCNFGGDVEFWWMSGSYLRVRIATQMGRGDSVGLSQLVYMVTSSWI